MSRTRPARPWVAWFAAVVVLAAVVVGFLATRDRDAPDPGAVAARAPGEAHVQNAAPPSIPPAQTEPPRAETEAAERIDPRLDTLISDEPYVDAEGRPSRALVRNALELAIAEHYPSYKLSEDDVERLTTAVLRMREARLALAELPEDADLAPLRRELVQEIEDAGGEFAEVMDMGAESFTAGAGAGGGVDRFDPDEEVPEPEFLSEPGD